jgi:hypothetical protein
MTNTLTLTDSRWRLLNALDNAVVPANAAVLADEQDAHTSDLRWLAEMDLVTTGIPNSGVSLDLIEHLDNGGAPGAVALSLNARGRKAVQAPQNRVLRLLEDTGDMRLGILLTGTGCDVEFIAGLARRALVTAVVRATGEPLGADDIGLLPPPTVTMRLASRGWAYLPRDPRQPAIASGGSIPRAMSPAAPPAIGGSLETGRLQLGDGAEIDWSCALDDDYDGTLEANDGDVAVVLELSRIHLRYLRDELGRTLDGDPEAQHISVPGCGYACIDWTAAHADGSRRVRFTDDEKRSVDILLTRAQLAGLRRQLTDDLSEAAVNPGAMNLTDAADGPYLDWSVPSDTGGRFFEVGDGRTAANLELTPDVVADLVEQLGLTLAGDPRARGYLGETGEWSIDWSVNTGNGRRLVVGNSDGDVAVVELTDAELRRLHSQLVTDLTGDQQ